jgi:hypothetical protein
VEPTAPAPTITTFLGFQGASFIGLSPLPRAFSGNLNVRAFLGTQTAVIYVEYAGASSLALIETWEASFLTAPAPSPRPSPRKVKWNYGI